MFGFGWKLMYEFVNEWYKNLEDGEFLFLARYFAFLLLFVVNCKINFYLYKYSRKIVKNLKDSYFVY